MHFKNGISEYVLSTGSGLFCILGQIFRQIVSIRVMTLINTNVVASRHIKREEVLLPVAVRHSKTPELN